MHPTTQRPSRSRRLALWAATAAGALALGAAEPLVLHVAPHGNDSWSGGAARPDRARTDGPLASLAGARDRIRALRSAPQPPAVPIHVRVAFGVYRLTAPFTLEPQDSGTPEAPIVYAAAPGARPIVSGGRVLGGFRQEGPWWETTIPEVKAGTWYFQQLWVNGLRRPRARSPNTGYHRVARLLPGPPDPAAKPVARDQFGFSPGDLRPWARLNDALIVLLHSWETSIHPIRSLDLASNVVHFAAPLKEWWTIGFWEEHQRFYVENALELLDEPGEWYLNRTSGVLSYRPFPDERLDRAEIVAPALTELVRFAGDPANGRHVEHVTLRGLSFQHNDWILGPGGNSSTAAAVDVPAALMADGIRNCSLEQCDVAHVGTYGVWFRRSCQDSRIEQTRLFDLGAGGIRVGEPLPAPTDDEESCRVLIDNNHIWDGGHVFAGAVGIWIAQSSYNRVTHNDIHDLPYSGMCIGWNWDDAPNRTHHNTIEFNHVHDLVQGVLSDAGLIYCLGVSPGSVIRDNVLHNLSTYARPPLGWGIYLDATCAGYRVENNLVYQTRSGGLMYNNGGHEHLILNNIFALGTEYSLWPFHARRANTFRHNLVYLTQGRLLIPYGEPSLDARLAAHESPGDWDYNLYWHAGDPDQLQFYDRSFAEWQSLGLDRNSLIADPRFVDPAAQDFRLQPSSPALRLGFRPIDPIQVGLYGDRAWAGQARHERCRLSPPRSNSPTRGHLPD